MFTTALKGPVSGPITNPGRAYVFRATPGGAATMYTGSPRLT